MLGIFIQDGGKVDIGTNSPDGSLVKTVDAISAAGRAAFLLSPSQNSVGGTQYGILARSAGTDGGAGALHCFPFVTHGGTLDNYRVSFWVSPDLSRPGLNIGFANTVTPPVFGAIFAGNVGIGLSAPSALLHVGGDLMVNDRLIFNSARASFPTITLNCIYATLDSGAAYAFLENNNLVIQACSSSGALRDLVFATGGTTPSVRMVISRAGNVGSGTDSPPALLHVVGANGLMRFQRDNGAAAIQLGTRGSIVDGGSIYGLGAGLVGLRFLQAFGGGDMCNGKKFWSEKQGLLVYSRSVSCYWRRCMGNLVLACPGWELHRGASKSCHGNSPPGIEMPVWQRKPVKTGYRLTGFNRLSLSAGGLNHLRPGR